MAESGQPRRDDVVLGGQSSVPIGGVVLGGLEGVRRGLSSPIEAERLAALTAALQHGRRGLYLVVQALQDRSVAVREEAYQLLHDRPEAIAQQAVQKFYTQQHYGRLQSALAGKRWKEADQETRIALFRAIGLDPFGEPAPNPYRITECPCRDLQIVDQLWVQYSRGRYGFSVQRSIWQPLHQLYWDKADVWAGFGDRVGWRSGLIFTDKHWKRYSEINFSHNAPPGHLPFLGDGFGIFTLERLIDRLTKCDRERAEVESDGD
ncbi:GUN4 domain-containing protein [Egbenema bharatensis]|uniref:GUN4 domain-containing protein n=1 Tax=Egbenema bharatensis TaxID=3463334 RepID=UPI003A873F10